MKGAAENPKWFEAFKKGDPACFDTIFKANSKSLYYYAYTLLANKADAEEVVMEVFIALWDERDVIKSPKHLVNWLYVVSQNKCLAILKKPKTVQLDTIENRADIDEQHLSYTLIRAEQIRLIEAEIAQLPPKMQEVFILRYVKGLDAETTADTLKISTQTVYTHTKKALEKLRMQVSHLNLETAVLYLLPLILRLLSAF